MDDIKVFPIIISKNNESSDYPYFVEIPDIDGMTEGASIADAMEMAKDYIGTYSLKIKQMILSVTTESLFSTLLAELDQQHRDINH